MNIRSLLVLAVCALACAGKTRTICRDHISFQLQRAGSAYYVQSDGYAGAPTCNSSGPDGNCNGWFIDPIQVINADGSTNPTRRSRG
jgi:hypothetical protein